MPVGTPQFITPKILELCSTLNPAVKPVFLRITPAPGSEPNDCFVTVRRKVEQESGRMQFGWAIWEWPHVFVEAENHAVYEPPTGLPWVDISPPVVPEVTRRLFLPDDTATYDFATEGIRRDNVRMPLAADPLILEFFRIFEERNAILNAIPGIGMVAIEGDAAERFQRNIEQGELMELHLGMKYTPQNAPCFCRSGKKFKRCHGQIRRAV